MKIIKFAICLSVFLFSLNAFGLENQEGITLVSTNIVQHNISSPSPIKIQDVDFFTKLCILLGISMVYWIYWLINARPHKNKP